RKVGASWFPLELQLLFCVNINLENECKYWRSFSYSCKRIGQLWVISRKSQTEQMASGHSTIYNQLAGAFRARGLDLPKAALVTQSVPLRLHLLANGPYLTAFARSTLMPHAERYGLTALAVDLPYRPWPVVLATLKNRTLSPVVERFIACAREM